MNGYFSMSIDTVPETTTAVGRGDGWGGRPSLCPGTPAWQAADTPKL